MTRKKLTGAFRRRPDKPGNTTRVGMIVKIGDDLFPWLPYEIVREAVDVMFYEITTALARGEDVNIEGFGLFSARDRQARICKDPRNNMPVPVPAGRHVVFFNDIGFGERMAEALYERDIAEIKKKGRL